MIAEFYKDPTFIGSCNIVAKPLWCFLPKEFVDAGLSNRVLIEETFIGGSPRLEPLDVIVVLGYETMLTSSQCGSRVGKLVKDVYIKVLWNEQIRYVEADTFSKFVRVLEGQE